MPHTYVGIHSNRRHRQSYTVSGCANFLLQVMHDSAQLAQLSPQSNKKPRIPSAADIRATCLHFRTHLVAFSAVKQKWRIATKVAAIGNDKARIHCQTTTSYRMDASLIRPRNVGAGDVRRQYLGYPISSLFNVHPRDIEREGGHWFEFTA